MNEKEEIVVDTLILAAGKSTRMGGTMPKVLLPLGKKKVIDFVIDVAKKIGSRKIAIVIGFQAEAMKDYLKNKNVLFVHQKEQLGTGHAVQVSETFFDDNGHLLILNGDVPLLTVETLQKMQEYHLENGGIATLLTTHVHNPHGYGRIIKNESSQFCRIVEEKDASPEEREIDEINAGIYIFQKSILFDSLKRIKNNNKAGEYYLTDVVELLTEQNIFPALFCITDEKEILGINTPAEYNTIKQLASISGK